MESFCLDNSLVDFELTAEGTAISRGDKAIKVTKSKDDHSFEK